MPGGPTSVTRRTSGRARALVTAATSAVRPISGVSGVGRRTRCVGETHARGRSADPLAAHRAAGPHGARQAHKVRPLLRRERQLLGQPLGQVARGACPLGFELADGLRATADLFGKGVLGQVERMAPLLEPAAEGGRVGHRGLSSNRAEAHGCRPPACRQPARFSSRLLYRLCPSARQRGVLQWRPRRNQRAGTQGGLVSSPPTHMIATDRSISPVHRRMRGCRYTM